MNLLKTWQVNQMNDNLSKEINAIQKQAAGMLENIRAVRGGDYEYLVRMMINLKNMILFFSLALHYSTLQKKTQDKLNEHFMNAFEQLLVLMKELSGIDAKDLTDVLMDAKNIDDAANRLIKRVIFKD